MKRWLVLIVVLAAACGSNGSGSEGDASAELACTHFRNVAADAGAGILTGSELRTKLQEVYNDAQVSLEPGVADGAREMLAAVTEGDTQRFETAATDFSSSCSSAGF